MKLPNCSRCGGKPRELLFPSTCEIDIMCECEPGACAAADAASVFGGGVDGGGVEGRGRRGGDVDCFASLAMTITAGVGRGRGLGYDEGGALVAGPVTASYDRGRGRTGGNNGGVVDGHLVASTLTSSMGVRRGCGVMEGCGALVAHTLRGEGHDASEDGTGRGVPLITESKSGIRRLTPRECERLQGFPDDWTLVSWEDGRRPRDVEDVRNYLRGAGYEGDEVEELAKTPDGLRYRAIGNSMAVTVMRWLGEMIADVEHNGRPE